MSRNYEPRYGRNYMKPIYTGGICIPIEESFEDTVTVNGDYGPTIGHFNSVTIHVDVPTFPFVLKYFSGSGVSHAQLSSFTKVTSGSKTLGANIFCLYYHNTAN